MDSEKSISPYAMKLDSGCHPFSLNSGYLYYYNKSSKEIKGAYLTSHYWITNWRENGDSEDGHKKYFLLLIFQKRYRP